MKFLYLIFLSTLFLSCTLPLKNRKVVIKKTLERSKKNHFVRNCNILSSNGEIKKSFPGNLCIFLNDGSFVSADDHSIKRIDASSRVLWSIPGYFHHQVNLSPDGKRIFALGSQTDSFKGSSIRQDKFLIISLEGVILHEQLASVLLNKVGKNFLDWTTIPSVKEVTKAEIEGTHFNSFYQIPSVPEKDIPSYIREGNIIVNGITHGIFILSPDLKQVLHSMTFERSWKHRVHDVQVNSRGNYIYFNNINSDLSEGRFSSLQEVHPQTNEIVFEFTAYPKTMFYSRACGSLQELDEDKILFTDHFNGTFIYSKKAKNILAALRTTHFYGGMILPQQVKAEDLSSFLSHWP